MDFFVKNKSVIFSCSTATLAGVFALEHIGKKKEWNKKPSFALNAVANYSRSFWKFVGKYIAIASGFYNYIDVTDLIDTGSSLLLPVYNTTMSPLFALKSYAETASLYLHPNLVLFGTFTLVVLFGGIYRKYNLMHFNTFLNHITFNRFHIL